MKRIDDKAEQCRDKMEDLRDKIAQIAKQKFDNLQKEFEGMLSLIEHTANMVDKFISRTETRGFVMSKKYYETLIGNTEEQIGKLQEEYDGLARNMKEALDSGAIENYSEEWYNMANAVNAVEEKIADATNKLYEYQKAMREIDWKVFELQEEYISRIQDESDFLIELLSDRNELYDKEGGMFTSAGKAVVGLHAVNYD